MQTNQHAKILTVQQKSIGIFCDVKRKSNFERFELKIAHFQNEFE